MARARAIGMRSIGIVLIVGIGFGWLQAQTPGAAAQTITSPTKTVCNITPGPCAPAGSITVPSGTTVQYQISFTNTGVAGPVTITDLVQPGQTYTGLCGALTGPPLGTCAFAANTVTFTYPAFPAGGSATVFLNAMVTAPGGSSIVDQAFINGTATNVTTVTVGAAPPPPGAVTLSKLATDVTTGSTSNVSQGDTVEYTITATNSTGAPIPAVTISDTLLAGQTFTGYCTNPAGTCGSAGGNTVQFTIPMLSAGSTTVIFRATVTGPVGPGGVVQNTATLTGNGGIVNATSNTTTLVGGGTPVNPCIYNPYAPGCNPCTYYPSGAGCAPPPCTYPYYSCTPPCSYGCNPSPCSYGCNPSPCSYGCNPSPCSYGCNPSPCSYGCGGTSSCGCNPCGTYFSPYCGGYPGTCYSACGGYPFCASTGGIEGNCYNFPAVNSSQLCGVVNTYIAPGPGGGVIGMTQLSIHLLPGVVVSGTPIVVGQFYCLSLTFDQVGQVVTISCSQAPTASPYVCGPVSQFTPGYSPGYMPYQGYNPNPTGPVGPYPVSSPYGSNYYGWGGPMMIGGYPYPVAPNVAFPFQLTYGSNYCFAVNSTGAVSGSLSVVPTAAFAVQSPGGYKHGKAIAS